VKAAATSRLGDLDLHLFNEGRHTRLYDHLGAHPTDAGTSFAVWAPEAAAVSVVGEWDGWAAETPLSLRGVSGIWEGFQRSAARGQRYKYRIESKHGGTFEKADPFGLMQETPPETASVVWGAEHAWGDAAWMAGRAKRGAPEAPVSIYELHLGSWRRKPEEGGRSLTYRELAPLLAEYVRRLGFTHVEFMPVMEHPFFGSWGYQVTGFFAPSSRFGPPEDLMFLVDALHQAGVGVIFDWVPSHFPTDAHGLYAFDGSHLYEHADPRRGIHPHWTSAQFNYGRFEVQSFLLSSAHFWIERFHADGLRVDGVASMLYLDYGREGGQWEPNRNGGREDLDAVDFLRALNTTIGRDHAGVITIAEESTAWPGVTRQVHLGGLGFGYKWDMGWMNDTLAYLARDPLYRSHHHGELTFRPMYAYSEHFVLALSHDESVHGKGSLLNKMPGDPWQQRANLRLLLAYQWTLPGKKLLFMGAEFAQSREWNHDDSLDWHLLDDPDHAGVSLLLGELNRLYRDHPALHRGDCQPGGFEWAVPNDSAQSVLAFERVDGPRRALVVVNATPVPRHNYRVGVGAAGFWAELLNTDAAAFGGSGVGNHGGVEAAPVAAHGRPCSLNLTLPPLGVIVLAPR
jgi:1,4-alpha-glucan branching enzyme